MPNLKPEARSLYQHILSFIVASPRGAKLRPKLLLKNIMPAERLRKCLDELESRNLIYRDKNSDEIVAVYPFSLLPTSHEVTLYRNGKNAWTGEDKPVGLRVKSRRGRGPTRARQKTFYAMCAIDSMGISFALDADVLICSRCPFCNARIKIEITNRAVSFAEPPRCCVWYQIVEGECISAVNKCPWINFFCSTEHLVAWRSREGVKLGHRMSLAQALDRAEEVFGPRSMVGRALRALRRRTEPVIFRT